MSHRSNLPALFRAPAATAILNVVAVGCSLAALTGLALGYGSSLAVVGSTFAFGSAWAAMLRPRAGDQERSIRRRWWYSILFAMGNAAVAASLSYGSIGAGLFAATMGVFIWGPALLSTLVCFGLPLYWAQRRAERGLAGLEQGDIMVSMTSALLAAVALVLAVSRAAHPVVQDPLSVSSDGQIAPVLVASGLGLLAGLIAAVTAFARDLRRREFVKAVEGGHVKGFRVDATEAGKVLLRVPEHAESYRVHSFEEELYLLDEEGAAVAEPSDSHSTRALP
jgi:hypothetical protein